MNIGVLGANGFLGRSLCSEYLKDNHQVYAFYNQNHSLIPKGCVLIELNKLFTVQLDCLVISIGGHDSDYNRFLEQNIFIDLIVKKVEFKRVLFISSVEVYGFNNGIININSSFNNPTNYGLAKLSQEFIIKSCDNFAVLRPTYIYGVGMKNNSLIPIWVKNALKDKEITIFGNGKREQDYLHIDDFTSLCKLVTLSNDNDILIAATGKSISNLALAKIIASHISGCIINYKGVDDSRSFRYDVEGSISRYGWEPQISIDEGIKAYIKDENFNI